MLFSKKLIIIALILLSKFSLSNEIQTHTFDTIEVNSYRHISLSNSNNANSLALVTHYADIVVVDNLEQYNYNFNTQIDPYTTVDKKQKLFDTLKMTAGYKCLSMEHAKCDEVYPNLPSKSLTTPIIVQINTQTQEVISVSINGNSI